MEKIKIGQGLIAIGGNEGEGKTWFSIRLANTLAMKEKVLFISYQTYRDMLLKITEEIAGQNNPNLIFKTQIASESYLSFRQIYHEVQNKGISTIFIDDLHSYSMDYNCQIGDTLEGLRFFVDTLNVSIIFTVNIDTTKYNSQKGIPSIKHFNYLGDLINECDQILAIYRPTYYGFEAFAQRSEILEVIEVYDFKNEENTQIKYFK